MLNKNQYFENMYKCLPKVYRESDLDNKSTLQRFLKVIFIDGAGIVLDDINMTLDLFSPDDCPSEFLPRLCESMGFMYTQGLNEKYQRKFLKSIGELNRRKGTNSAIQYLTRSITGLNCDILYTKDPNTGDRTMNVVLLVRSLSDLSNIDVDMEAVRYYISSQIPFYLIPKVSFSFERRKLIPRTQNIGTIVSQYSRTIIGEPCTRALPLTPTITAKNNNNGSVSINWHPVIRATSYEVHIWHSDVYLGVTNTTALSYLDTNISNGESVEYYVKAVNKLGSGDKSNTIQMIVTYNE